MDVVLTVAVVVVMPREGRRNVRSGKMLQGRGAGTGGEERVCTCGRKEGRKEEARRFKCVM
jgi:hypothetical protein